MALRDQPYLPLYIQDILTDEKLVECSASAHGIYLRLMCILHKQDKYGLLCLKQKHKQSESKIINFASLLCKQMPFEAKTIAEGLQELLDEDVVQIDGDTLYQKRMVKDGELSLVRSTIGKTGGSSVTKQYGKSGFLYLMSDGYEKNKIGISVNPKNRLYRLRSDLKLPKHFSIIETIAVLDMGVSEDLAHSFFGEKMDGEWVILDFKEVVTQFALLKAKLSINNEANVVSNTEIENESNITIPLGIESGERKGFVQFPLPEHFNGLPEIRIGQIKELIGITKKVILTNDDVKGMWTVFKGQNLDGKKYYQDEGAVYSHFTNWMKTQNFKDNAGKSGSNAEQRANSNSKSAGAYELLTRLKKENGLNQ